MIKRLFICCTPYQVFNCTNYLYHLNQSGDRNDLVVCNHFTTSKQILANCRKVTIWNRCIHMKTEFNRNYLQTMRIIHRRAFDEMMGDDNTGFTWDYDEVYLGTFNNIASIIAYQYCKKENKKLIIMDEGIATYILPEFKTQFSKKQRAFRVLLNHVIKPEVVDSVVLYQPDWYCSSYSFQLKELDFIDRNQTGLISILNQIFDYNSQSVDTEQVVFFDQPITSIEHREQYEKLIQKLVGLLQEHQISYTIQWHPRTDIEFRRKFNGISDTSGSLGGWEMKLLNQKHKSSKIYITPFSTAALLGKMLFDENDQIIFMFKLLGVHVPNFETFLRKVQEQSANVSIPDTWEALEELLPNHLN